MCARKERVLSPGSLLTQITTFQHCEQIWWSAKGAPRGWDLSSQPEVLYAMHKSLAADNERQFASTGLLPHNLLAKFPSIAKLNRTRAVLNMYDFYQGAIRTANCNSGTCTRCSGFYPTTAAERSAKHIGTGRSSIQIALMCVVVGFSVSIFLPDFVLDRSECPERVAPVVV